MQTVHGLLIQSRVFKLNNRASKIQVEIETVWNSDFIHSQLMGVHIYI